MHATDNTGDNEQREIRVFSGGRKQESVICHDRALPKRGLQIGSCPLLRDASQAPAAPLRSRRLRSDGRFREPDTSISQDLRIHVLCA